MKKKREVGAALVAALALIGCTGSSGHGGGGGASVAPSTSGTTSTTTPPPGPVPSSFTGVWEVSGTDPTRGPYSGTAAIVASGSTYTIQRLVTYQTKLPSGRDLVGAWNATGAADPAGLRIHATLRRAHIARRVGSATRTAADAQPLVVDTLLAWSGSYLAGSPGGLSEKWVHSSNASAPPFPATDETLVPIHGPPSSQVRALFWNMFTSYRALPAIAPYVSRPDFQAAIHSVPVDHTARDYYQKRGPTVVVVLDEVVDDISVFEETLRANAFSYALHEKAAGFDKDMETNHLDTTGMIANLSGGSLQVSGDGALHTGSWVASQAYRYQATADPQALANVEKGVAALVALVDITPDKTTFARAIQDAATAPANWTRGTGAYANVAWLPGGNNDMLHGIEYGFLAAEQVLPAGHPLRAAMGAQARSLIENVSIAQSGTHEILLSSVAWHETNDPAMQSRYRSALQGNLKERVWTSTGDGIFNEQGIADWSGHHLGIVTFCSLRLLGGSSPDPDELSWRQVATSGAQAAFTDSRPAREGLLEVIAAAEGASGAADQAKDILAEVPWPKPSGDADLDRSVSDEYCVSPYPSDPWKNDWLTNPGRVQALTGIPIFYRGTDENYWARGPLFTSGSVNASVPTSQDFLHAYWLGRATGTFSASD